MITALEEFFNSSERIFHDPYKNISGGSTEFDQTYAEKRKQRSYSGSDLVKIIK